MYASTQEFNYRCSDHDKKKDLNQPSAIHTEDPDRAEKDRHDSYEI
jgi:hypothetical protein